MSLTAEREMLRETVAALVAKHASPAAVRAAIESPRGYDESLWLLRVQALRPAWGDPATHRRRVLAALT